MSGGMPVEPVFSVRPALPGWMKWAAAPADRLLGLYGLQKAYERAIRQHGDGAVFLDAALEQMELSYRLPKEDLERIPRKGPLIVVANHPFGCVEGLILGALIRSVRPDVRLLANYLLGRIPELRDLFVLVDPFGEKGEARKQAAAVNVGPMRHALRLLRDGGVLGIFPAGTVAHLHMKGINPLNWRVRDPHWSASVATLIRRSDAQVLPVFFPGHNDWLFQLAGLIHPMLRTVLLPRALLGMRGRRLDIAVGAPIAAKKFKDFPDDNDLMRYLRQRTYMLQFRHAAAMEAESEAARMGGVGGGGGGGGGEEAFGGEDKTSGLGENRTGGDVCPVEDLAAMTSKGVSGEAGGEKKSEQAGGGKTIIAAVPGDVLAKEVEGLPGECLLVENPGNNGAEGLRVYAAVAGQMPSVLREIGRLREVTFRDVGEGTGNEIDLDEFDRHYLHLFVWNPVKREVVGAYRLGLSDVILKTKGREGLYTQTLFEYPRKLMGKLGPSIELGRSFVRKEYQRSHTPLLLLWKGIGNFVVKKPKYKMLFGPVSISADYQSVSRQLIVQFLTANCLDAECAAMVKPRQPFKHERIEGLSRAEVIELLSDHDEVSDWVSDLEPDEKGIPVLLRQYLKLGARVLSVNVDKNFGDCVDALIVIDLTKTDRKLLERYLTKAGVEAFYAHHQVAERV